MPHPVTEVPTLTTCPPLREYVACKHGESVHCLTVTTVITEFPLTLLSKSFSCTEGTTKATVLALCTVCFKMKF